MPLIYIYIYAFEAIRGKKIIKKKETRSEIFFRKLMG